MRYHSRGTRAVPHLCADPGHSREPGADGTRLSRFFQPRPTLTRGASAHLTTRTLTQTGGNSLVGATNWATKAPTRGRWDPS
jgi:hypothetical protein